MDKQHSNIKFRSIIFFLFLCIFADVCNTFMVTYAQNEQIFIGSHEVDIDSIVDVPIIIINAKNIAGGFIVIRFNNSVVSVENITEGDFGQPVVYVNNTEGVIRVAVARATAIDKQNATMAIIRLKSVEQGYTDLTIINAELNDEEGNLIYPSYNHGSINVIPEFTSFAVLTTGLLIALLMLLVQKRRPNRIRNPTDYH
jgi:hypothetical protein